MKSVYTYIDTRRHKHTPRYLTKFCRSLRTFCVCDLGTRFRYRLPLLLVFSSYFEYVSKMFPQLMTGLTLLLYYLQFRDYKWTVIFDNFHLLVFMLVAKRRRDAGSGFKRRSVCIYVDLIFWMSSLLYVASRRPLQRCLSPKRPVVQAQWHTVTHLLTKGWQPVRGVAKVTARHCKEVIKL